MTILKTKVAGKILLIKGFISQDEGNPVEGETNGLDKPETEKKERRKSKPRVRRKTGEENVQLIAHRKSTNGLDYVHRKSTHGLDYVNSLVSSKLIFKLVMVLLGARFFG